MAPQIHQGQIAGTHWDPRQYLKFSDYRLRPARASRPCVFGEEAQCGISRMRQPAEGTLSITFSNPFYVDHRVPRQVTGLSGAKSHNPVSLNSLIPRPTQVYFVL